MGLDDYLETGAMSIGQLAEALECAPAQVRQWKATAKTKRFPGAAYCVAIERVTGGAVKRSDLRPDWRGIWPELSQHDESPKPSLAQAK